MFTIRMCNLQKMMAKTRRNNFRKFRHFSWLSSPNTSKFSPKTAFFRTFCHVVLCLGEKSGLDVG